MIRATNQRHAGSRWWPGEFRQSVQLHQNLSHTNIHLVEHTHTNSHRADTVEHAGWVVGVQRRWGVCDEGGSVRVPRHRRLDGALTWTTWVWSSEGCGTLRVFKQASRLKGRWMSRDEGGGGRGEGWTEGWASSLDQSDLLLEGSLCGPGGGVSGGCLDRLVGHDTRGELLLGSLETGAGGSVRRMDLKRKRRWFTTVGTLKGQFRHKYTSSHNLLPPWWGRSFKPPCCAFTFLNMMSDKTASAVKRAAMRIIMMPTGMLVFRAVSAEIHPLQSREAFKDEDGEILEFSFYKRWTQTNTHRPAVGNTQVWIHLQLSASVLLSEFQSSFGERLLNITDTFKYSLLFQNVVLMVVFLTLRPTPWCRYTAGRRCQTDRCTRRRTRKTWRSCHSCRERK